MGSRALQCISNRKRQARTCVSGQRCAFDGVLGLGLVAADSLQVLDSCGQIASYPGLPAGLTLTQSGAAATWGAIPLTMHSGVYRICWCRAGAAMWRRSWGSCARS